MFSGPSVGESSLEIGLRPARWTRRILPMHGTATPVHGRRRLGPRMCRPQLSRKPGFHRPAAPGSETLSGPAGRHPALRRRSPIPSGRGAIDRRRRSTNERAPAQLLSDLGELPGYPPEGSCRARRRLQPRRGSPCRELTPARLRDGCALAPAMECPIERFPHVSAVGHIRASVHEVAGHGPAGLEGPRVRRRPRPAIPAGPVHDVVLPKDRSRLSPSAR